MFYISSVIDKDRKIGVTDTRDGVEEFYTDSQIAKFLQSDKIDIYGTSYYNYKANCTALNININLKESTLKSLIKEWGNLHNQWTGHKVEDYLACAKVGTKVIVDYIVEATGGRRIPATTIITRISQDEWLFEDKENVASGDKGDSRFAAWALEVACLYSKPKSITVINGK